MKKLVIGFFALAITTLGFSQQVDLESVEVTALNQTYLNDVLNDTADANVKHLESYAAQFDISEASDFTTNNEAIEVSFKQRNNSILAQFNKDGKIVASKENYKNVLLPYEIRVALVENYPEWTLHKDSYHVNYSEKEGSRKMYKVVLKKGKEKKRIKLDAQGNLI